MKNKLVFFLCLLTSIFLALPILYGQEIPNDIEQPLTEEQLEEEQLEEEYVHDELAYEAAYNEETEIAIDGPQPLTPERQRIEQEIRTSSLSELAAWARTLGLSESGTREDLAMRIRVHFELPAPSALDENQRIITIESAQITEYFSIDAVGEDFARLSGDVRLTLQDGDDLHRISAEEILFNRTRNIITARGRVEYRKESGDTTEIFRGESITVNIDNWSSIFLDGDTERTLEGEGTAYRFEGEVISRTDEDVMFLRNARITDAHNEDALWSISASRLWLLPGSDFAILNAVLRVGTIPVLYIPVFFFPADELIFHPVIGFRTREGAFVQTTTYIIGRPQANPEDQSSLARILGNANDMERERHGIFLRTTGNRIQDPSAASLSIIADYYNNLGFYFGMDLSTPRRGILNPVELSMGIGFTRTLTLIDGSFTPFAPEFDGSFDWNHSNLFSIIVPFRYRFRTQSSISGRFGNLSWNIPFYSDPFVDMDFMNRSTSMDWINMIQQGAAMDETEAAQQEIGAYQWHLSGRLNPSFPSLAPFISNVALNNISMSLGFRTFRNDEIFAANNENPGRFFFAPERYTIYSVSASISGTPLTIGDRGVGARAYPDEEIHDPLRGLGIPRSPWGEPEETEEKPQTAVDDKLVPPVLAQTFDLPRAETARFTISYELRPTSSSELLFRSGFDNWQSAEDVDWREIQQVVTDIGGTGNINFNLNHSEGFFTNIVTFSGSGRWRDFTYLNEDAEFFMRRPSVNAEWERDPDRVEAARRAQWSQTNYSISYAYTGTLRPFFRNSVFGQTDLQYGFTGILVRSKRFSDDSEGPELRPVWGKWVRDRFADDISGLQRHRFSTNIRANVMNHQQSLTVHTDLPPLEPRIETSATVNAWISTTVASINFRKPEYVDNEPNDEWIIDPLTLTETLRFSSSNTATFRMIMAPELDNEITDVTSSLTLWGFRASFTARRAYRYEFILNTPAGTGGRWERTDNELTLRPLEMTFTYRRDFGRREVIRDRLDFSVNINSNLNFNLQQHTNSNFTFSYGFTLGINNFLDLSLSATSGNSVIFRYFSGIPWMDHLTHMYIPGPQNNVFIDLFDSFAFWDITRRQRSGFNMRSFNLRAVHFLGDWTASLEVEISPFLNRDVLHNEPPRHELNTVISFLLQWRVISEIKSDIRFESRTDRFTVQ